MLPRRSGRAQWRERTTPGKPWFSADSENELRVVGHAVRRPRRVERQLGLGVFYALDRTRGGGDVLLDHRTRRTAHRRQAVEHLHLRAVDLDVVEKPEIDDIHAELRVLDLAHSLDYVFSIRHQHESS